jgi:hypothetical protein
MTAPLCRLRVGATGAAMALIAAMALTPVLAAAQALALVPVVLSPQAKRAHKAKGPIGPRVRIHTEDSAGLAEMWGLPASRAPSSKYLELTLQIGAHPETHSSPDAALASSFIVDYDHPAVSQLRQKLLDERADRPITGSEVVAFTAQSMRAHLNRDARLASKVAQTLEGDCTEYSLLTAALARSLGIPARIVHGVALIEAMGKWEAYGHAWVQTFESGRWVLRDSALARLQGSAYYVPTLILTDEGPGYGLEQMRGVRRMPSKIEILDQGTRGAQESSTRAPAVSGSAR